MNPKQSRYYTYVRPLLRSKFAKTYSPLIFSLVTISIFSYYAIRPTVTTILSLQKSVEEQSQVRDSVKEKIENLTAGAANYANIPEPVRNKLSNMIPDNPALPSLVRSLTFAVDQAEASLSGIQVEPIIIEGKAPALNKDAATEEVAFSFNTEGEFSNLMQVLTSIRRLDRLVTITSVNFNKPQEGALIMRVEAKAYYTNNQKSAAAAVESVTPTEPVTETNDTATPEEGKP